jgi:hypothetical protein
MRMQIKATEIIIIMWDACCHISQSPEHLGVRSWHVIGGEKWETPLAGSAPVIR